jgi:hypothetical protein
MLVCADRIKVYNSMQQHGIIARRSMDTTACSNIDTTANGDMDTTARSSMRVAATGI